MRIVMMAAMVVCLAALAQVRAADTPATAPAQKPALVIHATTAAKAKPGDKLTVTVEIQNTTDGPQTIDIPSMWWAVSDNAAVAFPKWPRMGGIGPVMIFKPQIIEAGKSFSKTWEATVGADAAAEELTFKVGIPLKRGGENVWSDEVKVTVEKP